MKGHNMLNKNYAVIIFDKECNQWRYVYGLTKKECIKYIKSLDLGKDLVSYCHIVKMVDVWNAYDGLIMKGGKYVNDDMGIK